MNIVDKIMYQLYKITSEFFILNNQSNLRTNVWKCSESVLEHYLSDFVFFHLSGCLLISEPL